jgi:hypothetical protein
VLSFHYNDNAPRLEHFHQRVGDLAGHPLLHLRSPSVNVDQPGQLGQARNLTLFVRNVPDVGMSEEWRQVMLACREKLDIANKHHFIVVGIENRREDVLWMLTQPRELLGVRPRHPDWGIPDPFPVRILANRQQYFAYCPLDALKVN